MKSERNKPCSCGSGKKYKRCCLRPKSAPDDSTGLTGPVIYSPVEERVKWRMSKLVKRWNA